MYWGAYRNIIATLITGISRPWFCIYLFFLGVFLFHVGWELPRLSAYSPPQAFSARFLLSVGPLFIGGAPIALGICFLRRFTRDVVTLSLFAIAAFLSLHYLYTANPFAYTNDWQGHMRYAQYIGNNWFSPYGYRGWQHHHQPFFYYLPATVLALIKFIPGFTEVMALHFLSWIFYLCFACMGVLTISRMKLTGSSYYIAICLFLLWPAGTHLASKISNEIFYYFCYAAAFYHALVWYQEGRIRSLLIAIMLACATFIIRGNGIEICIIIALMLVLSWRRGRFSLRSLRPKHWYILSATLGLTCLLLILHMVDFSNFTLRNPDGQGWYIHRSRPAHIFLSFDYTNIIRNPFADFKDRNLTYWDFLLKTSIYGEYTWQRPYLASVLNALLFSIVLYSTLPWLTARRAEWKGMFPCAIALLVTVVCSLIYASYIRVTLTSGDARYLYPALPCFAILVARSHALYGSRGAWLLTKLGPVLVGLFVLLGAAFFWGQTR